MIVSINEQYRAEPGKARKRAVATPELLDDSVTAKRYQVGQRGADGRFINIGQEMEYLDDRGPLGWYLYEWGEREHVRFDPHTGEKITETRNCWVPVGWYSPDEIATEVKLRAPDFDVDSVDWSL